MTANINIKKLKDSAVIPTYGSEWAAGADLYACLDTPGNNSSMEILFSFQQVSLLKFL